MKLEGTVAIVTGAAQGIGKAIVERFLERGAKWVAILDINKQLGIAAEEELAKKYGRERIGFIHCDIAYLENLIAAFDETFNKFKRLDIVINNAAIQEETQWDATVQINYLAVVRGIRLAKQYMSKKNGGNGGVVISTASVNGFRAAWVPVYASTKAAIISLTRCLPEGDSNFMKEGGMRVGTICPGYVETVLGKAGNMLLPDDGWPAPVPMKNVIDGYISIIEDDSLNGIVMTTTLAGNKIYQFKSNEEVDKELELFK